MLRTTKKERELTDTEKEILVELRKVLAVSNDLDENLKKCMSLLADPVYMASGDQAESFRALVKTSAETLNGLMKTL